MSFFLFMFCATFGVFMFYTTNRTHSIPTQTTFRFNYTHFKINDQFIPKTGKCLNNQLNGPNVISIFGVFDENVVPMNSLKLHETGLNHDLYCKNSVSLSSREPLHTEKKCVWHNWWNWSKFNIIVFVCQSEKKNKYLISIKWHWHCQKGIMCISQHGHGDIFR